MTCFLLRLTTLLRQSCIRTCTGYLIRIQEQAETYQLAAMGLPLTSRHDRSHPLLVDPCHRKELHLLRHLLAVVILHLVAVPVLAHPR
jgi:hypothetical protein